MKFETGDLICIEAKKNMLISEYMYQSHITLREGDKLYAIFLGEFSLTISYIIIGNHVYNMPIHHAYFTTKVDA